MKRAKILVVDDEPDLVELLQHHLRREHYDVATASDGEKALAEARRIVPDLVVLDLMLPGMDGLEVCRRLRADPRTMQIPIVMLTAKGEESDAVIGLAQGADDYVRKPFGTKEFLARIAARLRLDRDESPLEMQKVVRHEDLVVDPVKHEAVSAVPAANPEDDGRVVGVVRHGYTIGDDVLRPAAVAVASASAADATRD